MATIPTRTITRELDGHRTDILIQSFTDRVMVIITQLGKVGNLIQATIPLTTPLIAPDAQSDEQGNALPAPSPAIQLTHLLGSAAGEKFRTLQSLYVAQAATLVWLSDATGPLEVARRPVIVGLALKIVEKGDVLVEQERQTFLGVMDMLQQILQQQ